MSHENLDCNVTEDPSDVNLGPNCENSLPESLASWHEIDWKSVNKMVTRMRRRIYRCSKLKQWKKLRSLQRLFVKSDANLLYSIRHVTYGSGRKTAGIDEITILSPVERLNAYKKLSSFKWAYHNPLPVKRIYIAKPDGRQRPIGIPSIYDRILQMVIKNALEPEWEARFEGGSYGFRPSRSVNDAINRIFVGLNKPGSRVWVVDADVSQCFDSIDHKYLLSALEHFPFKPTIEKWLNAGITLGMVWFQVEEGTPQGGVLSPLLCNIALHGLESELGIRTINDKGHLDPKGRMLVRYADDFAIFCRTKKDAETALDLAKQALNRRGLNISESKTRIVHTAQGFDFLGFNIRYRVKDGYKESNSIIPLPDGDYQIDHNKVGLFIHPSAKSINNIKQKLRDIFADCHGQSAIVLITRCNAVIRGWAESKKAWHSNRTFHDLDHFLFNLQWAWACRQHPNKNKGWIKKRYYSTLNLGPINNRWTFTAPGGIKDKHFMYQFKWFPIDRHVMVKNSMNPDDPDAKEYWAELITERALGRTFSTLRRMDNDLADSQNHICPICNDSIYNGEEIHRHHLIAVSKGGTYSFSNLVLLHLPCHYQLHYAKGVKKEELESSLLAFKNSHPRIVSEDERKRNREAARRARERKRMKNLGESFDLDQNF